MFEYGKKYWKTIIDIMITVLVIFLVLKTFSYIYKIAQPVFLSFLFFIMMEPLTLLFQKLRLRRNMAATLSALVFGVVLVGLIFAFVSIVTFQLLHLSKGVPQYLGIIQGKINTYSVFYHAKISGVPTNWVEKIQGYVTKETEKGVAYLTNAIGKIITFGGDMSKLVINTLLGYILAYFLSLEKVKWKKDWDEFASPFLKETWRFLETKVFTNIIHYVRAQIKIILIVFVCIETGLLLFGVQDTLLVASLGAIVGMVPLIGMGTIFVPWIGYLLITGQNELALKLGILFIVVEVIKHLIQPKILGDSLGISSFIMFSSILVAMEIFGPFGIFISPILLIFIKAIWKEGYLKKWIRIDKKENPK